MRVTPSRTVSSTLTTRSSARTRSLKTLIAAEVFNERVRADDRVVSVLLTVRDGVTLIRRR